MTDKEYPFLPKKVDIYISYTQRVDKDKEIALAFYDACKEHKKLEPHIDSEDLGLHADIYEYMDKLSTARLVVCVLSKDYFKSINCVSEFAGLCHNGFIHERVFPLFIHHFFDDKKRKKRMKKLINDDDAKQRVKKNTGGALKDLLNIGTNDFMDKLAGFVREDSSEFMANKFKTFIDYFLDEVSKQSKKRLKSYRDKLEAGIQKEMNHSELKSLVYKLENVLGCDGVDCAKKLLEDPLTGLTVFHKFCCENNLIQIPALPVRKIAGFLLVAMIDDGWWLMNEFALQRGLSRGVFSKTEDINHYSIEIVFSRVVEKAKPALYKKDGSSVRSESLIYCPKIPVFSGDPETRKNVLLKAFYEKTMKEPVAKNSLDADKLRTLRGAFKIDLDNGRQPFYIISQHEFEALNKDGIIDDINEKLEKCVVFVVVGKNFEIASASNSILCGDIDKIQYFIHEFAIA